MNEVEYKMRYATTEVFIEKPEILPPVRSSDNCHLGSQVCYYFYISCSNNLCEFYLVPFYEQVCDAYLY